ncbi:MAG TPA: hypothetical protein VIJ42_11545 [Stellaceae bacterium]
MSSRIEVIESIAGEVATELNRRGVSADERVTILIDPAQELIPGRRESRVRVIAAGLNDADIANNALNEDRPRHQHLGQRRAKS